MKKIPMIYMKNAWEVLSRRKVSVLGIFVAVEMAAIAFIQIFRNRDFLEAAVCSVFAVLEAAMSLFGFQTGKCPCCGELLMIGSWKNNYIFFCRKCSSVLYKREDMIYGLKTKEFFLIKPMPVESICKISILFLMADVVSIFITSVLDIRSFIIKIIYLLNIIPVIAIAVVTIHNYILKKKIEVNKETEK